MRTSTAIVTTLGALAGVMLADTSSHAAVSDDVQHHLESLRNGDVTRVDGSSERGYRVDHKDGGGYGLPAWSAVASECASDDRPAACLTAWERTYRAVAWQRYRFTRSTEYLMDALRKCSTEDAANAPCSWDADLWGNGKGRDFVALKGARGPVFYYVPRG